MDSLRCLRVAWWRVQRFQWEQPGWRVLPLHQCGELRRHLRMPVGDVVPLTDVLSEMVQLDLEISIVHVLPDGLPVSYAHRLLPSVAGELTVQEWSRILSLPEQCGCQADSIDLLRLGLGGADQFQQGGSSHPRSR